MASKNQDSSVAERRLRPIYEWLDSGNNKKALQECDKVLKKTPGLHCARALKALSLLRIGKYDECRVLLEALTEDKPFDDATLQAMTLCYRETQQLERICALYETAVKLDAGNEELHTHLFMSYVRVSDFKSQQKSALALYKLKPKNPYYCWAIMSVVLQATRGEGVGDPKKRELLLSLAERMMLKLAADGKLEAEQEVQLYVMILELQGKFEEVLGVLDGALGAKIVTETPPANRLPYLAKLQRWREVNLLCKALLAESIDRWNLWKEYLNSVFRLYSSQEVAINNHLEHGQTNNNNNNNSGSGDTELETVDDTPDKAHEFICRLVENGSDNSYLLRGPYLARFELCAKLDENGHACADLVGDLAVLFVEYFRKFGHKTCCVSDLRGYLRLLSPEQRLELASRLVKEVGISLTSVPLTEQQMQKHICALQLSRLCGAHQNLSHEHLRALVTALSLHYQHGYQAYSANLLSTDQGPSDPYALLASHVLYDLAQATKSLEPIFVAVALLDGLLKNSPSNFHAKLVLIRLYHTIGGCWGAHAMYESLDVKHLQLDSLGYVHCARVYATGLFSLASYLFDTTLKFFSSNYKDSSDHLTFSYKFGSFVKLNEFMDFRERLNNSLHYTSVSVDRMMLNLILCNSLEALYAMDFSPKDDSPIDWEALRDNHDLSVYACWDPERIDGPPEESESMKLFFRQNVDYLRLRVKILHATSAAVDVVRSTDGTRSKNLDALKTITANWRREASETCTSPASFPDRLTLPLPSRLLCYAGSGHCAALLACFDLFACIAAEDADESARLVGEAKSALKDIVAAVGAAVRGVDGFCNLQNTMEKVVNCAETLCISTLACALCHDLIKATPAGGQGRKSCRRRGCEGRFRELLASLAAGQKSSAAALCDHLRSWSLAGDQLLPLEEEIAGRLEALSLSADGRKGALDHLTKSQQDAVGELLALLRAKEKLLAGFVG